MTLQWYWDTIAQRYNYFGILICSLSARRKEIKSHASRGAPAGEYEINEEMELENENDEDVQEELDNEDG